ncbi:hypothetical protein SAMN05444422_10925 [Halobiforma haloterrestris]|uniref:Uncharacterized protein n=1 Tax=Natronobacterium haloterrestre TaxID=148448 RepID=A0A1I1JP19_NATHA|nr:hypothetical protein SAMN05444422_10925 [Halobiforma haloterrestris]
MSMGNFIGRTAVLVTVMAASNPSPTDHAPGDDPADTAAGMAHPTVVPTNFDPEEHDLESDE